MKRSIYTTLTFTLLTGTLVLFQNCGKAQFAMVDGTLVAKDVGGDETTAGTPDLPADTSGGTNTDGGTTGGTNTDGGTTGGTTPPATPPPTTTTPPKDPGKDHDTTHDDDDDEDSEYADDDKNYDDETELDGAYGKFICILDGPGKSVRLGINSDSLAKNGRTPHTVCMTETACRNIVSQVFKVKGPERRGFCGKNPHTVQMTDAEVQAKIDALKK